VTGLALHTLMQGTATFVYHSSLTTSSLDPAPLLGSLPRPLSGKPLVLDGDHYICISPFFLPGAFGDNFLDKCKVHVVGILNGTETHGPINNETINESGILYHGSVAGINPNFPREDLLTVTPEGAHFYVSLALTELLADILQGCQILCGTDVNWYWLTDISLTLGIVSNWVIPIIALLAVLPYDSQNIEKNRKQSWLRMTCVTVRRTLGHLYNWLGPPQTALTATFFNIYQMKMCLCAARLLPMGLSVTKLLPIGLFVTKPDKPLYKAITDQNQQISESHGLLRKDVFYLLRCIS